MHTDLKIQAAAILGILLLALLSVAPWLVGSHVLRPKSETWSRIIARKDELLAQKARLEDELKAYQNMAAKKQVNADYRKNIEGTNLESLQGFMNSGKYSIYSFKTIELPESNEVRFSFAGAYNALGQLLSELWNTFQFLEVSSLVMKPSPTKPDEDAVITLVVRLPLNGERR